MIAPSGAVLSPAGLARGLTRLAGLGCRVRSRVPEAAWLRFAGTDDERLDQIHASAEAEDVDLVMVARGGYGLSRLLDRIDWGRVAASVARGVRWVGFSDFTAFHLALLAQTGAASWAGPSVCADFGGEADPDPQTLAALRQLMRGEAQAVSWLAETCSCSGSGPGVDVTGSGLPVNVAVGRPSAAGAVRGSTIDLAVEGPLWGGNLAMIASLAGTRWMPQIDGGILFIEDVAEHPYRVERMLLQLLHAGVLARQRAIVFGDFTNWKPATHDNGFDLVTVRDYFADRLGIPIVTGLPFGHARRHAILGVGQRYRLESVAPGPMAGIPPAGECAVAALRLQACGEFSAGLPSQIRPSSTA